MAEEQQSLYIVVSEPQVVEVALTDNNPGAFLTKKEAWEYYIANKLRQADAGQDLVDSAAWQERLAASELRKLTL